MTPEQLLAARLSGWTNLGNVANLLGSDYPAAPTPCHILCWDKAGGEANGWTRVKGAERTIVRRPGQRNAWHVLQDEDGWHNLPEDTTCFFCGGQI